MLILLILRGFVLPDVNLQICMLFLIFCSSRCNQMPSPSLTQIDLSDGFFMSSTIKVMSPSTSSQAMTHFPVEMVSVVTCVQKHICDVQSSALLLSIKADHDLAIVAGQLSFGAKI